MSNSARHLQPLGARCLLVLSLVSSACRAPHGPLDPIEQAELVAAERRWAARSFHDYSFELRRFCSCPAEWRAWSAVHVRADSVTDVHPMDSTASLPLEDLAEWPTIDSLFAAIRQFARSEHIVALAVSFDPQLGFPTVIDFDGDLPDVSGRYEARSVFPPGALSNKRMQLPERARRTVCMADYRPSPTSAAATQLTSAPGGSRLARSAIDARIR